MAEQTAEIERLDACPNDCGDHCGNPAWSREDQDARTERLRPLAEHLRLGHDVPEDERGYRDTWLHIALLADEWWSEERARLIEAHQKARRFEEQNREHWQAAEALVEQARTWILNCVDPEAVGADVKQDMLDRLNRPAEGGGDSG